MRIVPSLVALCGLLLLTSCRTARDSGVVESDGSSIVNYGGLAGWGKMWVPHPYDPIDNAEVERRRLAGIAFYTGTFDSDGRLIRVRACKGKEKVHYSLLQTDFVYRAGAEYPYKRIVTSEDGKTYEHTHP